MEVERVEALEAWARRHGRLALKVLQQRVVSLSCELVENLAERPIVQGVVRRQHATERRGMDVAHIEQRGERIEELLHLVRRVDPEAVPCPESGVRVAKELHAHHLGCEATKRHPLGGTDQQLEVHAIGVEQCAAQDRGVERDQLYGDERLRLRICLSISSVDTDPSAT